MARKATMMPTTGGGVGARVVTTLVIIAALAMLVRDPIGSAHTAHALGVWIAGVVDSLAAFGSALSSG